MQRPVQWLLPFSEPPSLELDADAIALEIVAASAGEEPRIESLVAQARHPGAEVAPLADPRITVENGVVHLKLPEAQAGWPFWGRGRVGVYRLVVPRNLRARIHCAAGQLRVEGMVGCDLDLSTGAGQILLRDVHGRLALAAQAGQIRGERVGGTLQIHSSMGAVRLQVDALDPGTHRVHSSMGAVRLELVPGLKVRIDARTSMGSTRNRYPTSPDADIILALETDLGSVRIDPGGSAGSMVEEGSSDWRSRWEAEPWHHGPPGCGPFGGARFARGWRWADARPQEEPARSGAPNRGSTRTATRGASDEELKRILTLVEQGKINAVQASELIRALEGR